MSSNVFVKAQKEPGLEELVSFEPGGRENIGPDLPVPVYRLFQFSIKQELAREYGKEKTAELFRKAGFEAGVFFAGQVLDLSLELNKFISDLQSKLELYKIGILRVEKFDPDTGRMVLTVSEDADCSGLPVLGETVCNYDEGFISGILFRYTKKKYLVTEIDCWGTGDRVCRFNAEVKGQDEHGEEGFGDTV